MDYRYECYPEPVSLLKIKRGTESAQKQFVALVDRILVAKRNDPDADTSALEREIDELVYALYDLTPEEIQIVEGAAK
ncbi:MAG: hypothetical protein AB7P69_07115 [Candidatus Binatia bacterium]